MYFTDITQEGNDTQPQPQSQQQDHEWTSIRIYRTTLTKLDKLGHFKETYSDVLDRILSEKLGLQPNSSDGGSW